jgi:hypothetical protein
MNYYFTYGSNMDYDQMMERCPNAEYFGIAFLQDYKLAFTRYSSKRESAVADILVSPGDIVWGLIYIVNNDDLENLDKHEGHPTIYRRIKEKVFKYIPDSNHTSYGNSLNDLNNYKAFDVEVYEVVNKDLNLFPNINYLSLMQDAAFENSFPSKYQEELYRFGLKDYNKKLQIAIDCLLEIKHQIESIDISEKAIKQEEWGGANLVVTGSIDRKKQLNRQYPQDLVVLTPYWREIAWVIVAVYDEKISWQVDYLNKYYVFEQLGQAALEYQLKEPNDKTYKGICLAVLNRAYKVFISDFYKEF